MLGIIVSEGVLKDSLELNRDKNYLTSFEIAALVDNHIANPTYRQICSFLVDQGVTITTQDDKVVIYRALALLKYDQASYNLTASA